MVRRQRRIRPTSQAGADAGDRERSLAATRHEYRRNRRDRSLWPHRSEHAEKNPRFIERGLCARKRHHILHAPRRLARVCVCDNLYRGDCIRSYFRKRQTHNLMIEEIEREYTALSDKVRELREYL